MTPQSGKVDKYLSISMAEARIRTVKWYIVVFQAEEARKYG